MAHTKHKSISMHPDFKIENIVASADLGVELDLYAIAKASPDVDYEPEQFPGAICKIHNPKTALLLFKNGKIICILMFRGEALLKKFTNLCSFLFIIEAMAFGSSFFEPSVL